MRSLVSARHAASSCALRYRRASGALGSSAISAQFAIGFPPVEDMSSRGVGLTLRRADGTPSGEGLILLEDLAEIARMDGHRHALLQLDLKEDDDALDDGLIESFRRTLACIAGRCIVSGHDWRAVSRLAEAVPGLRRGFDPCADDTLDRLRDALGAGAARHIYPA